MGVVTEVRAARYALKAAWTTSREMKPMPPDPADVLGDALDDAIAALQEAVTHLEAAARIHRAGGQVVVQADESHAHASRPA